MPLISSHPTAASMMLFSTKDVNFCGITVDELNDKCENCASVKLLCNAKEWLLERVCGEVDDLYERRIVVVLPVYGPFFPIASVSGSFLNSKGLLCLRKRLLGKLVNSVLLKVDHDDEENLKFKL